MAPSACAATDELAPCQGQRGRAGYPHEGGNAKNAENAGEVEDGLAEIGGYREREDQRREGQAARPCCRLQTIRNGRENNLRAYRGRRRIVSPIMGANRPTVSEIRAP